MKTIHALLLLSMPAIGLVSCGAHSATNQATQQQQEVIPVKLLPLGPSSFASSIAVSGQFTTDDEVMLSFKTSGIIQRILVKEGDAIRQGQVVASLNLTEINAQVQQAQLGYEKAQRDHQRALNLYKDSVATLEQLQNTKTALDLSQQQLNAVLFNRSHSEIRATHNGYVLRKLASEGQVIGAGTPVIQTNGAQSGNWLLRVALSNKDWAAVQLRDSAAVEIESAPGETFRGEINRKSEGIDPATGAFYADIRLIQAAPASIAFGLFGKAMIYPHAAAISNTGDKWEIPYDALLDGDGSHGYVFVTNDGKRAHKQPVIIAGMEKDRVLISNGLQGVQAVVISGSAYLTDNSPIRVIP